VIHIYGDDKKIAFTETAGVTRKRPFKSGWSSFFCKFVRFLNSVLSSHFVRSLKCKYTAGGILEQQVLFSEVIRMHKFS